MKPASTLLQSSKDIFSASAVKKISFFLTEEEGSVKKALRVIIPTMLYGLSEKAATWNGSYDIAFRAAHAHQLDVLNNFDEFISEGKQPYMFLLTDMFGERSAEVVNTITVYSCICYSSVVRLISLVLDVILALLGKHRESRTSTPIGLAALLVLHKNEFVNDLPAGIDLIGAEDEQPIPTKYIDITRERERLTNWMFGLLLVASSVLFFIWLSLK